MTTTATAKLTGITMNSGQCDQCGRELGRVFAVQYADGTHGTLGRRCAAKATGCSRPESEAARIARIAARDLDRASRRADLMAEHGDQIVKLEAMPQSVHIGGGTMYASPAHMALCDVFDGARVDLLYGVE